MNNTDNTIDTTKEATESRFGKFGTAEELLHAYNALQSEFTKRCQLLKQLQAELDALRAQAGPAANDSDGNGEGGAPEALPDADDAEGCAPQALVTVTATTTDDKPLEVPAEIYDNMQEYAEILSAIPEVMNACIASYKKRLLAERSGFMPIGGAAVIVPANRPRTLSEAKAIADKML